MLKPLGLYILEGHRPVLCEDTITWARWYEDGNRRVADDTFEIDQIKVRVSTVFLGIDHNYILNGPPALFETMVFGGALDQEQVRCSTWHQAEVQHQKMLRRVRQSLN